LNLYTYARNTPTVLVDVDGRQTIPKPVPGAEPPLPPPPQIRINRESGLRAAANLKSLVEGKGFATQSEVTLKGGKGGSRIDLTPAPAGRQTLPKMLESKHIDLSRYRTASGQLDVVRLRSVIGKSVNQVLKHEKALRAGKIPDLPFRESLVYTVENANSGEAATFQRILREVATPKGVKGGVVVAEMGTLLRSSGAAPPERGSPVDAKGEVIKAPQVVKSAGPQPKTPGVLPRLIGGLTGLMMVASTWLNVHQLVKEVRAELRGEDLTPEGHYSVGSGGNIINDYSKLPEGFDMHVIHAPDGSGRYYKKDGLVFKDGYLVHGML
jgi:hypothetical protein